MHREKKHDPEVESEEEKRQRVMWLYFPTNKADSDDPETNNAETRPGPDSGT